MKKCLFLFFLIGFYIGITNSRKTQSVFLVNDETKPINTYQISFQNGINSNFLIFLFDDYNGDYLIEKINENEVRCNNINTCVKSVFDENDSSFEQTYINTGFKVNYIEFIAYDDEIKYFLNKNNLSASVKY